MTQPNCFLEDIKPYFGDRHIVYVDIGAFHGEVYKSLKSKGIKFKEAHLIEPNYISYKNLSDEVEGDPFAFVHNVAASSHDIERVQLFQDSNPSMSRVVNTNNSENLNAPEDCNILSVESKSYDAFSKGIWDEGNDVALLKIDVEGHELEVIRGASKALDRQNIDVIYIEAGLDPGNTQQTYYRDIEDILNSFGYKVFKIYEQKNEWIKDSPLLRRINIAFFSSKFAESHPPSLVNSLDKLRAENNTKLHEMKNQKEEADRLINEHKFELKKLQEDLDKLLEERNVLANQKENAERSLDELKKELKKAQEELEKQKAATVASKEIDLILLQLHQTQEELKHYFYQSRGKDELLKISESHQQRTKNLLTNLLAKINL